MAGSVPTAKLDIVAKIGKLELFGNWFWCHRCDNTGNHNGIIKVIAVGLVSVWHDGFYRSVVASLQEYHNVMVCCSKFVFCRMGSHDTSVSFIDQRKGYAIEYIAEDERFSVVQQGLVCSVCDGILRSAVQVSCGGRFCQKCHQDLCKWVIRPVVLVVISGNATLVPFHIFPSLPLTWNSYTDGWSYVELLN